jgi:hypothetical protein
LKIEKTKLKKLIFVRFMSDKNKVKGEKEKARQIFGFGIAYAF